DADVARASADIEATIQDREVEQLCGLALAYAADGDMDLAQKIATKIARLAPQNPRYLQLKSYVDEESERRTADALAAAARDHLGRATRAEAGAAAEEALHVHPSHAAAREIVARVPTVLASQERAASAREPKPGPAAAPAPPPSAPAPAAAAPQAAPPAE